MQSDRDFDVAIIGGGPAGASGGACLARAGRRVVLFERDRFPRFHIGESLLASVNDALAEIGASELVRARGFPVKWGATFSTADATIERSADFATSPEVPTPQTWQVPRAEFDELLLRHAARSGVDVREAHRIVDVAFEAGGAALTVRDEAARESTVRAAAVVDASGRVGVLARKFDLRVPEHRLDNIAVFSHYSGVPRLEGRRSGDIRIIARHDLGWFWIIPISDELTSVGVVLPRAAFDALPRLDPAALLEHTIGETPAVASLMREARREWPARVEKDFSFGARAYAGDRWLVVGDAGSFLDPVFSTGVAIALESGVEAAQALDRALGKGDLSARMFRAFDRRQQQRYRAYRRFVLAFYTRGFRDFFFQNPPLPVMFRALIASLAGYWRPSLGARLWQWSFFVLTRIQERLPLVSQIDEVGTGRPRLKPR
ncbi:MAG TPA: NAD(P)/FAD-dependent oxidoreductase [Candidatus Methylomirabilis sp.]|nr:NAD(P)/FAD-dependent oxidoreductase [Candidatus Methylomirabilis sp.]